VNTKPYVILNLRFLEAKIDLTAVKLRSMCFSRVTSDFQGAKCDCRPFLYAKHNLMCNTNRHNARYSVNILVCDAMYISGS
jgi:hypothetical protein